MSFAIQSIFCSLHQWHEGAAQTETKAGGILGGFTHYCADSETLCLEVVALEAIRLCVQLSLAEMQFEHGDPLSHPICTAKAN